MLLLYVGLNHSHPTLIQHNTYAASNLLEGTIPSELALLSNSLEQMHVEFNPGLEGEIPPEFANLTNLWSL